jgi:hypothetical protein
VGLVYALATAIGMGACLGATFGAALVLGKWGILIVTAFWAVIAFWLVLTFLVQMERRGRATRRF